MFTLLTLLVINARLKYNETLSMGIFKNYEIVFSRFYSKSFKNARTNVYILANFFLGLGTSLAIDLYLIYFGKQTIQAISYPFIKIGQFIWGLYSQFSGFCFEWLFKQEANHLSVLWMTLIFISVIILGIVAFYWIVDTLYVNSFYSEFYYDVFGVERKTKKHIEKSRNQLNKIAEYKAIETYGLLKEINTLYNQDYEQVNLSFEYFDKSLMTSQNWNNIIKEELPLTIPKDIAQEMIVLLKYFSNNKLSYTEQNAYAKQMLGQDIQSNDEFNQEQKNKERLKFLSNKLTDFLYYEYRLMDIEQEIKQNGTSLDLDGKLSDRLLDKEKCLSSLQGGMHSC